MIRGDFQASAWLDLQRLHQSPMRLVVVPLLTLIISCGATFALVLYAGVKRVWPLPQLRRLVTTEAQSSVRTDQFGRLLSYPGKIEITCPI
jgi:hypothetical protein